MEIPIEWNTKDRWKAKRETKNRSFLFSPNLMRKLRKMCKMRKTKCWEPLKFPTKMQF